MIGTNWENFLKNLGEWHGSFTKVSLDGELLESTPSILCLEGSENNQVVSLRLRRFRSDDYNEPPTQDYTQEYRSLGKQIIFFDTGAFSKGSIQVAPFAEFGAEYGFVTENRRLRFVQLYDTQGCLRSLTLIREFRNGTPKNERPPLTINQLLGKWEGTACTAYSDWTPAETYSTSLEVKEIGGGYIEQKLSFSDCAGRRRSYRTITSTARIDGNKLLFNESSSPRQILLLPDGTSSNTPLQVTHRQQFFVELGWLLEDNQRQRLIRSYNDSGQWISSTHVIEHKL